MFDQIGQIDLAPSGPLDLALELEDGGAVLLLDDVRRVVVAALARHLLALGRAGDLLVVDLLHGALGPRGAPLPLHGRAGADRHASTVPPRADARPTPQERTCIRSPWGPKIASTSAGVGPGLPIQWGVRVSNSATSPGSRTRSRLPSTSRTLPLRT